MLFYKIKYLFIWQKDTNIKIRLLLLITIFFSLFIAITFQTINLSLKKNNIANNRVKQQFERKDIVDANGNTLAVNLPSSSLYANPYNVIDANLTLKSLSKILKNLDTPKILKELSSSKNFVWIKHDLTPIERQQISDLGLPGLAFEDQTKRFYIYGNLFSHILGFVGRDNLGLAGAEKFLDKGLIKNSDMPLELTLDLRAQNIASEELESAIKKFGALGGVAIIADVTNGNIIASVSKPDFNPNDINFAAPEKLFNQATLGVYELGSIIKALVLPVGFDTGQIKLSDLYDLENNIKISKFVIKDYHKKSGWHSVAEIFMDSSNIGLAQILLEIGRTNLKDYWQALGLFSPISLEVAEKGLPIYRPIEKATDLDLITMSYGYSFAISPMHFVQAMIPVVNGGYYFPLTLVKNQAKGRQIFNSDTSAIMNKLLRLTVSVGTGKKSEVVGQIVGGKTGTAEKLINKKYSKSHNRNSFIAAFPMISPKYVVFVMLDEPKGLKETFGFATAGWSCAPTAGAIIERLAAIYGMPSYDVNDAEINEALKIEYFKNEAH